jgi:hypothetical protein
MVIACFSDRESQALQERVMGKNRPKWSNDKV